MRVIAISLFFALFSPFAFSEESSSEESSVVEFVDSSINNILEIVKKNQEEIQKNPELMMTLLSEQIEHLFDMNYIPKGVLGARRRTLTEEQMKKFTVAYKRYMLYFSAKTFFNFKSVEIEYKKLIYHKKYKSRVVLPAKVTFLTKENISNQISIDFKLRFSKNQWKIYDFNIEHISFINSQRTVNNSIIEKKGIDGFIQDIELLTNKLKF